jgi:hypothetical protein
MTGVCLVALIVKYVLKLRSSLYCRGTDHSPRVKRLNHNNVRWKVQVKKDRKAVASRRQVRGPNWRLSLTSRCQTEYEDESILYICAAGDLVSYACLCRHHGAEASLADAHESSG